MRGMEKLIEGERMGDGSEREREERREEAYLTTAYIKTD